ncbi:unnamed protein product, partial [Brassica oleracea]
PFEACFTLYHKGKFEVKDAQDHWQILFIRTNKQQINQTLLKLSFQVNVENSWSGSNDKQLNQEVMEQRLGPASSTNGF